MIAKDGLDAKLAENSTKYKSAIRGDLIIRVFDGAKGIFKYNYRTYDGYMTTAYWTGEGIKSISTHKIKIWCREDNKWKWIRP